MFGRGRIATPKAGVAVPAGIPPYAELAEIAARMHAPFGLVLDGGLASLTSIDLFLDESWGSNARDDLNRPREGDGPKQPPIETIAALGAYLGEVLAQQFDGGWDYARARHGTPPSVPVALAGGITAWPIARLLERYRGGSRKGLEAYARVVREQVFGANAALLLQGELAGWVAQSAAWMHARRLDRARLFADRAVVLDGTASSAWYQRALICDTTGDRVAAVESYRRFLSAHADPNLHHRTTQVAARLARLESDPSARAEPSAPPPAELSGLLPLTHVEPPHVLVALTPEQAAADRRKESRPAPASLDAPHIARTPQPGGMMFEGVEDADTTGIDLATSPPSIQPFSIDAHADRYSSVQPGAFEGAIDPRRDANMAAYGLIAAGLRADFTLDSIPSIDTRLDVARTVREARGEGPALTASDRSLAWQLGCYLGETVLRAEGGLWELDHTHAFNSGVTTHAGVGFSPFVWVERRLVDGTGETVDARLRRSMPILLRRASTPTAPPRTPSAPAPAHVSRAHALGTLILGAHASHARLDEEAALNDATAALDEGEGERALTLLAPVLRDMPSHRRARILEIDALASLGRFEQARVRSQDLLRIDPHNVEARERNADLLARAGEIEEAIRAFDEATAMAPDRASLWLRRGRLLESLSLWEKAIASYHRATQLDPQLSAAWSRMGNGLLKLSRWQDALTCFREVTALGPDDPRGAIGQAKALVGLGTLDEALVLVTDACELADRRTSSLAGGEEDASSHELHDDEAARDAWRLRGTVEARMGRDDEARRSFEAFLTRTPSAAERHDVQAKLDRLTDGPQR